MMDGFFVMRMFETFKLLGVEEGVDHDAGKNQDGILQNQTSGAVVPGETWNDEFVVNPKDQNHRCGKRDTQQIGIPGAIVGRTDEDEGEEEDEYE